MRKNSKRYLLFLLLLHGGAASAACAQSGLGAEARDDKRPPVSISQPTPQASSPWLTWRAGSHFRQRPIAKFARLWSRRKTATYTSTSRLHSIWSITTG